MQAVLLCLDASPYFMEMKFFILDKFIDYFEYKEIDSLLSIFEKFLIYCDIADSYLATNINPVKTSVLLMDFVARV